MTTLTRILSLTAACALVVLAGATPARAGEPAQKRASVGAHAPSVTACQTFKRAISRRTCVARLERAMPINTAANK
jgi:hypothetical protein